MTKQDLIELIQQPDKASQLKINQLDEAIREYPYFQALHVLRAKISSEQNQSDKQIQVGKAAIHTADRSNLKRILEGKTTVGISTNKPIEPPAIKETFVKTIVPKEQEQEIKIEYSSDEKNESSEALFKEVMENLNTLHSLRKKYEFLEEQAEKEEKIAQTEAPTKKKGKKKVEEETDKPASGKSKRKISSENKPSDDDDDLTPNHPRKKEIKSPVIKIDISEQNTIIESFIKKETEISKRQPERDSTPKEDLSINSTMINDGLVSENLAQIFVEQGKTERAIDIYKKLIWKFPQKKSYFASRIEELSK